MDGGDAKCINCGSTTFVEDPVRGDSICGDCGCCVPDRLMDETLEKRNFMDSGKDHNRGAELDKYTNFAGQTTIIGSGTGSLQRAQARLKPAAMSSSEQNLVEGFKNLRTFETMFSLSKAVANAARDVMVAYEKKKDRKTQGARAPAFALACVFAAMQRQEGGRSIKELAAVSSIPESDIRGYYAKMGKFIQFERGAKVGSSQDFVHSIVSEIRGSALLEQFAAEILDRGINHVCTCFNDNPGKRVDIDGKRRSTTAAAAILVAAQKAKIDVKVDDLAVCAQVSTSTVVSSARNFVPHWAKMFEDHKGSHEPVLKQLQEQSVRMAAMTAPTTAVVSEPKLRI